MAAIRKMIPFYLAILFLAAGGALLASRSVSVLAWILAALITLVFATVINFIVLRKVRNLKLTDVA